MRCVTGVLKRWDERNRSRNLGASPIKIQVEEDESKRSTFTSDAEFKSLHFPFIGRWTLDVGRWTFSDCRLNSSNSLAIRFEHAARNLLPGSCGRRFIIRSMDIIRAVEHQLAAGEIISPA
jgi:hypothetical protein